MGTFEKITSFGIDLEDYNDVVMMIYQHRGIMPVSYDFRPLFTSKNNPDFLRGNKYYATMQFPMFCQITDATMDSNIYDIIYIKVNDPSDHALIDEIIQSLVTSIADDSIDVSEQYSV